MILNFLQISDNKDGGPPYPLPRSSSGRALLKGALARGHVKRTRCKGKNGKKGKGETLDLIVTIDLVSTITKLPRSRSINIAQKKNELAQENDHLAFCLLLWPPTSLSFLFWN